MHAMLTALWLAMQDETPKEPDDDEDDEDEGGGGMPVVPPRPSRWPPRIRLFLPRLGQPAPVGAV